MTEAFCAYLSYLWMSVKSVVDQILYGIPVSAAECSPSARRAKQELPVASSRQPAEVVLINFRARRAAHSVICW